MGAALHLAHVHQAPPGPKRKRKGGGGGSDGYDKLVTRIWQDPRQTPESRELLLLLTWLISRDPNRYDENGDPVSVWARADKILGWTDTGAYKRQRVAELVYADRPRYEMGRASDSGCRAPMIRREGLCGSSSSDTTSTVDPATGWRTPVSYCRRHETWGRALHTAQRAMPKVNPIPNKGGLMPSYLSLTTGQEGWQRIYEEAARALQRSWEPPAGFGLKADDWPTPGAEPAVPAVEYPRLRLAAVDGELLAMGEG